MDGFRRIASLHELAPLKAVTSDAFPASFTDKVRKASDVDLKNSLLTLKNKLLSSVGALAQTDLLLNKEVHYGSEEERFFEPWETIKFWRQGENPGENSYLGNRANIVELLVRSSDYSRAIVAQ